MCKEPKNTKQHEHTPKEKNPRNKFKIYVYINVR